MDVKDEHAQVEAARFDEFALQRTPCAIAEPISMISISSGVIVSIIISINNC